MRILDVKKLRKSFGGLEAVKDVSFYLEEGEVLGLMGPNGAGKTTVFNLITGVYKPDSGTIKYKTEEITGLPPHEICHFGIVRTYQIPQPFHSLTVFQNVFVAARYGGNLGKVAAEKRTSEDLDIVGILNKKDTLAGSLKLADLKRLELARALACEPEVVLVDEVAAGLREAEIPQILEILKTVNERGITILLIEHVMKVMVEAVDRLMVMDTGEKIAEGSPKKVMEDERVIESYLGR